jgi:glycosyltransferase 2 family protein
LDQPEPTLISRDTARPRRKSYRWAKRTLAYTVALGCLVWVFHDMHMRPLIAAMKIASWRFVSLAIMLDILTYILQGMRWRTLLSPIGTLSTLRATQGVYAGLFVNELVPLRLGELIRAFLVSRWLSLSLAAVIPSIVVERLLDGLSLVVGLGIATIFSPLPKALIKAGEILGVTVFVGTALFLWISFKNEEGFEENAQHSRSRLLSRLSGYLSRFIWGLRHIGVSRELFLAALMSVAMLALQVLVLRFIMKACRLDLSLLTAGVVFLIIRLGTTIPNAPANVGTFQLFTVVGLRFFGVEKTAATAFSIVYFGVLTIPLWTLGLLAMRFSDLNLQTAQTAIRLCEHGGLTCLSGRQEKISP